MPAPDTPKRKMGHGKGQDDNAKSRVKRQKIFEAREIRTQLSHEALNERKELDVSNFVKSRESEIRALEASITSSKSVLSTRAFQQVPRHLRRRTASHNVKRVPKRLRTRALKEVRQ
jgi:ribonuclease P/MRP protein subunit POP1